MNIRFDPASHSEPEPAGVVRGRSLLCGRPGRAVAWAVFALVGIASILPGRIMFRTGAPPELEHVLAYAVAGGIFVVVYGRKGAPASLALLTFGAIVFELAQNFVPGRTPRVIDAACSMTGSLIGITGGLALRWLWSKRRGIWRGWPAL